MDNLRDIGERAARRAGLLVATGAAAILLASCGNGDSNVGTSGPQPQRQPTAGPMQGGSSEGPEREPQTTVTPAPAGTVFRALITGTPETSPIECGIGPMTRIGNNKLNLPFERGFTGDLDPTIAERANVDFSGAEGVLEASNVTRTFTIKDIEAPIYLIRARRDFLFGISNLSEAPAIATMDTEDFQIEVIMIRPEDTQTEQGVKLYEGPLTDDQSRNGVVFQSYIYIWEGDNCDVPSILGLGEMMSESEESSREILLRAL